MKAKSTNRKETACSFIKRQSINIGLLMLVLSITTTFALAQKSTAPVNDNNIQSEAVLKNPVIVQPVKSINYVTPSVPLCPTISSLKMIDHTHQMAILGWDNLASFDSIRIRYAVTGSTNYRTISISGSPNTGSLIISGLAAVTAYDFEISTICLTGAISNWSPTLQLTTFPEPAPRYSANQRNTSQLKLYPNPATSYTTLSFSAPANSLNSVLISTSTGKVLIKTNVYCADGKVQVPISLANVPSGVYFVQVGNNLGLTVERLIVH